MPAKKGLIIIQAGIRGVGRWEEEERVIQLVTSNPMGRRQIKPFCCSSEASFNHLANVCLYLYFYLFNWSHSMGLNWSHPIQWVVAILNLFDAIQKPASTAWLMYIYIYSIGHIQSNALQWVVARLNLFVAVRKPTLATWLMYASIYMMYKF